MRPPLGRDDHIQVASLVPFGRIIIQFACAAPTLWSDHSQRAQSFFGPAAKQSKPAECPAAGAAFSNSNPPPRRERSLEPKLGIWARAKGAKQKMGLARSPRQMRPAGGCAKVCASSGRANNAHREFKSSSLAYKLAARAPN